MAYTTINKSTDYFNTKLFTGNGSTTQGITGVGFKPDWLWIKCRNETADHQLSDAVRGKSGSLYYQIQSNGTGVQVVQPDNDGVHSLDSDGFTVGYTNSTAWNKNSNTYAAWNWKAGGSSTSSNSNGSITSNVSVNSTAGFSIVSYTGTGSNATVGHGLSTVPKLIITKALANSGRFWGVYHTKVGNTKSIALNSSNAPDTSSTYWQDTDPTNTVFSVGTNGDTNSASAMIAYCFEEKTGYSKFGSYTGNGNADGTFVYTGFKPAWVLVKKTSAAGNGWFLMDTKTNTYNPKSIFFQANSSNAETDVDRMDILSNGFKPRYNWSIINDSGATYIYMAFAAAPLVGTNNIPATAR